MKARRLVAIAAAAAAVAGLGAYGVAAASDGHARGERMMRDAEIRDMHRDMRAMHREAMREPEMRRMHRDAMRDSPAMRRMQREMMSPSSPGWRSPR